MRRCVALAALVLLILPFPTSSEAKKNTGGAVLWEDQFAIVEIAASDGRVAAVGTIPNGSGGRTSIVRVYDTDKGKLLWQDTAAADTVIIDGNRVVIAGGSAIRAYDAKKGRVEWRDVVPFPVTQLYRDRETTLATATTDGGGAIRVRVYDTKRGSVMVADQTLSDAALLVGHPIAFAGGKMFVGTRFPQPDPTGSPITIFPCHVRAYAIATGQLLWATTQPFLFPNTWDCGPMDISADGERVVLAGIGSFFAEFMAQSYDAKTGEFLWQYLTTIGASGFNAALTVDTERQLVFVGGWTRSLSPGAFSFDNDFVVQALEARSGALRWDGRTRAPQCLPPGVGGCLAFARIVVADSGTVYGAGFLGENGMSTPGTGFLRAYEANSGELRWQDDDVDVQAIAATSGTVVVLTPGAVEDEVILRAYDAK